MASRTTPTLCVLVMAMGVDNSPASFIQWQPVNSPLPFWLKYPAFTEFSTMSSQGTTTVTPVRAMPSTGPLPSRTTVEWPTLTPGTSVMAL